MHLKRHKFYILILFTFTFWMGVTLALSAQSSLAGQVLIKSASTAGYLSQASEDLDANVYVGQSHAMSAQVWDLTDGPDGTLYFQCQRNGQFLNAGSDASGTSVAVYSFNAGWWSMMWFLEPVSGDQYRIKNRWANLYLTRAADDDVRIYPLSTAQNQLWVLDPTADCVTDHAVDYPVNAGEAISIHAANQVSATGIIANQAQLEIRAGSEVLLDAGFDAQYGCEFLADIQECDSGIVPSYLANADANDRTQRLYQYLRDFQQEPDQCLILGQNIGWSFETYQSSVTDLQQLTGEWLGIIGGQMRYSSTEIDYPALVDLYANWQAAGGICELSMLPDNPWTGGSTWDRSVTDIAQLTLPGSPGYAAWRSQLDFYAEILSDMQDAGVSILFRPLMEMNGDWFWYGYVAGQNNQQAYIDLYRDMYDYFTNVKQLNNLIWVYSANMAYTGIPDVDYYYPGADVVDVTGLDVYADGLSLPASQYQTMISLDKPFAFTEFGPHHDNMDGSLDYEAYTNEILTNYPEVIYAHAWHDWPDHAVAWISNQQVDEALAIPCIVGREEIGY